MELLPILLDSIPKLDWIDVIVVDDHSDKGVYQKLQVLLDGYDNCSLYVAPEGKKGPGVARNVGIEHSNADWLLFADSDDYFSENAFQSITKYVDSDLDVVYFAPDSINLNTNLRGKRHKQYEKLVVDFLQGGVPEIMYRYFSPCSKLISSALVEENTIRFDDGVGGEDNNFSLKLAFYSKNITADKNVIYMITESDDSLTRHFSETVLENHFFALSRYNDFLQAQGLYSLQVPMLGWVVKAYKINFYKMWQWFWICIKKRYPLKPLYFVKKIMF